MTNINDNYEQVVGDFGNKVKSFDSQIKDIENEKTDKSTTDDIQQQINNLVLGAVGDGNNAEVVQARGEFEILNDRLDSNEFNIKNMMSLTKIIPTFIPSFFNQSGVETANTSYIAYKFNCSFGDLLNIKCRVGSNVTPLILFFNENNTLISKIDSVIFDNYTSFKCVVPRGTSYAITNNQLDYSSECYVKKYVNSIVSDNRKFITFIRNGSSQHQISNIIQCYKNDIIEFIADISIWYQLKIEIYDTVDKTNLIWSKTSTSNGRFILPVDGYISLTLSRMNQYPTRFEVNAINGTSINYISKDNIQNLTQKLNNLDLDNQNLIFVTKIGDKIIVNSKYDEDKDFQIKFYGVGINNLYQFGDFGIIKNNQNCVSDKIDKDVNVQNNGTDWFSPYVLKAINNANGDYTGSSIPFTGGIHGYGGSTTGATPTAKTINLKVKVNGRYVTGNFKTYARFVEIEWDNYIQGANTQLNVGGGREIIKEHIHLTFNGIRWEVENEITALEDVAFSRFYGLQSYNFTGYSGQTQYLGSSVNKGKYLTTTSNDCGDKKCRTIKIIGNEHICEYGIYNEGLGDFELNTLNYSAFNTTSKKSYFNLIYNTNYSVSLLQGESLMFKGYYKFYPKI